MKSTRSIVLEGPREVRVLGLEVLASDEAVFYFNIIIGHVEEVTMT